MSRPEAYDGTERTILYAMRTDGSCPAREFIEALDVGDRAKIFVLFERLGDTGKIANQEKFKKIVGTKFFEFKSFQIRLICFYQPGGLVIITHGFKKKSNKTPKGELERAERIKAEDRLHNHERS